MILSLIKIIVGLMLIQGARASLLQLLLYFNESAGIYANLILVLLGAVLYLIFKPDYESLGLSIKEKSRKEKRILIGAGILVLLLIIAIPSLWNNPKAAEIIAVADAVLIFPVFEELIFRGYIWSRLKKENLREISIFTVTTVLFGLWHLGYWDTIYMTASAHFDTINMAEIMLYKVFVGAAYGIVTGLTRWKTKSAWASIIVHCFFNIFGR